MIHGSRFARFLFAALIGAASALPAGAKERRPNLLVIVADARPMAAICAKRCALRWRHMDGG